MTEASVQGGLGDKLIGPMTAIIDKRRAELVPMLGGAGHVTQAALQNDECVRKLATFCYPLLPGLVRLAVKEPVFVNFVLNNREKVLGRLSQQTAR